jgi:hypothetical protein
MRSDKTSHRWWLFYGQVPVSEHFRTMQMAMDAMLTTWNAQHPSLPLAPAKPRRLRCGYCTRPAVAWMTWKTIGRPKGALVCKAHKAERDRPDNYGDHPSFRELVAA